jgi:hypothetical protein
MGDIWRYNPVGFLPVLLAANPFLTQKNCAGNE